MTVLSPAAASAGKTAITGFPIHGPYSYITLLLDFLEWGVDLPWVRARLAQLETGEAFAALFGEIIVQSTSKSRWCKHPEARSILQRHCETLLLAWNTTLAFSPDRDQLSLDYLADALRRFAKDTQLC